MTPQDRLLSCAVFTLPVVLLSLVPALQFPFWQWTAFVLATPVVTVGAWPLYRTGLRPGATTVETPAAVAAAVCYGWSAWAMLAGGAGSVYHVHPFSPFSARNDGSAQIYFEAATGIVTLALFGRAAAEAAARRAGTPPGRVLEPPPGAVRAGERAARIVPPVLLAFAAAVAGFWTGANTGGSTAVATAAAVLVVVAPMSLRLAAPLALLAGAARCGATIGDGRVWEAAAGVDTVVTGRTAVSGPAQVEVVPVDGTDAADALAVAAALLAHADEPVAHAVTAAAGGFWPAVEDVTVAPGPCVRATTGARHAVVGTPERFPWPLPAGGAAPAVAVGWDGRTRAVVLLAQELRPDAPAQVAELRALGLTPVLLTSAAVAPAQAAAGALGIDVVLPGARSEGRVEVVRRLQEDGHSVVVLGGVHDAAAMAVADVGVAVDGSPADLTLHAATTPAGALRRVRRAYGAAELGLGGAALYALVAVPLAAAGLVHPLVAATTGTLVTLAVLGNGLRQ